MTRRRYQGTGIIRREGAATVRSIRADCKAARDAITVDARARRQALRDAIANERAALRGTCFKRLDEARAATALAIEEARKSVAELDRLRRVTRSPAQQAAAERARVRGAEPISESDSAVRQNLSPDLAIVWERVKHRIRATKRASRTEKFLEWVEDHPGEAARIVNEEAERSVAEMPDETEAEYRERMQEERRRARVERIRASPRQPQRSMRGLDPFDVPF